MNILNGQIYDICVCVFFLNFFRVFLLHLGNSNKVSDKYSVKKIHF